MKNWIATAVAISVIWAGGALSQETEALESELADIQAQLEEAMAVASRYDGGLILSLIEGRQQALLLSQSLVQNRLAAARGEATVSIQVPAVEPDPERAQELLREIGALQSRIEKTGQEVEQVGGLIQTLALSRLETEKLTLAQLQMAYYQAAYGIAFPSMQTAERPAALVSTDMSPPLSATQAPDQAVYEWADPRFPAVDYSLHPFSMAYGRGEQISGWWTIDTETAVIDDSTSVHAINYSAYDPRAIGGITVLTARCVEGETALIMVQDDYLSSDYRTNRLSTAYRIDQRPTVESRWSSLTSNRGAGLFGREAESFIRGIYDAERLFIRVTDSRGRRADAQFDLSGGADAFDRVAAACGWTTLNLTAQDYRAIQTLLNAGEAMTSARRMASGGRHPDVC